MDPRLQNIHIAIKPKVLHPGNSIKRVVKNRKSKTRRPETARVRGVR
jgi:hypothetical protein